MSEVYGLMSASHLVYMVYSGSDYFVRLVRLSIIETESVGAWREFHVLDEHTPATSGIITRATTTIGMNLTCFEDHRGDGSHVLRLLLTGEGIGHAKAVGQRHQPLIHPTT